MVYGFFPTVKSLVSGDCSIRVFLFKVKKPKCILKMNASETAEQNWFQIQFLNKKRAPSHGIAKYNWLSFALGTLCPISVSHYLFLVFSSTVYSALMCGLG